MSEKNMGLVYGQEVGRFLCGLCKVPVDTCRRVRFEAIPGEPVTVVFDLSIDHEKIVELMIFLEKKVENKGKKDSAYEK